MSNKRLAVFVEGQTEAIFLEKLLTEIVGEGHAVVRQVLAKNMRTLDVRGPNVNDDQFFVLISNCEQGDTVKSRILSNREKLIKAKYDLVLGVRDLYPIPRAEINRVLLHLKTRVPTKGLAIEICLSVMEIESWFLYDGSHYEKIDSRLINSLIITSTGFDPENDNPEDIAKPSDLLRDIYRIAQKGYKKTRNQVERTVDVLDYEYLYLHARDTLTYSSKILDHLDDFF